MDNTVSTAAYAELTAQGKGYCKRHQSDIANKLQFYGLWKHVRPADAGQIAAAWRHGGLRREMMCPLVILMIEIQAKANRMAHPSGKAHVTTCPLCAIQRMSDDETADAKVLKGMGELVLALFQTNGIVGGDPSPAILPAPSRIIGAR